MSDERLREAERRWKESGSVEDEAQYLLERVRVGDLTWERLELAAYCGHEAARRSTVDSGSKDAAPDLISFLADVYKRSPHGLIRGGLVVAAQLHPFWAAGPRPDESFQVTLGLVKRSLASDGESVRQLQAILTDDRLATEMAEAGPRAPSSGALEFVRLLGLLVLHELGLEGGAAVPVRAIARSALKCVTAARVRDMFCEASRTWALSASA